MERLNIWGEHIPGNSNRKKTEVMELRKRIRPSVKLDTIRWILTLKDGKLKKNTKKTIDTYVDRWVKQQDPDYQETFTDVPYLLPFIAPGSKKAVIVVPGGGYCVKGMEGEGTDIAKKLQENGITAFVLWYRTCPYYQPYPLMDLQRAVRYVRYHAEDYGYDPKQIGAIGFSAGGAQVALFMNVLRHGHAPLPKYEKDEIDAADDAIQFAGLIYPALKYQYNINMMYASFPADEVRDEKKRTEYQKMYDAIAHMNSISIPHFVCYGTKDTMVSLQDIADYVQVLETTSTPHKKVVIEGAGHGFGAAFGTPYGFWLDEYISWVQDL